MPTFMDNLLEWCRDERAKLQQALELMESGKMRLWSRTYPGPDQDMTPARIKEIKSSIAELDSVLAKHPHA